MCEGGREWEEGTQRYGAGNEKINSHTLPERCCFQLSSWSSFWKHSLILGCAWGGAEVL